MLNARFHDLFGEMWIMQGCGDRRKCVPGYKDKRR